jgi:hypothetical protein
MMTAVIIIHNFIYEKKSDNQQIHQYQENEYSPLTSNH